jgi:hypothetical protein
VIGVVRAGGDHLASPPSPEPSRELLGAVSRAAWSEAVRLPERLVRRRRHQY